MKRQDYNPLTKDHPAIGLACGICGVPLEEGDVTVLIPKEAARPGSHVVEAAVCHVVCAGVALARLEIMSTDERQ